MNSSSSSPPRKPRPQIARVSGRSTLILMLVVFLLGVILAGTWFKYGAHTAGGGTGLSDHTLDLLRHLNSPVEIRYYSVLPPGSAPESLQDFSQRVDHLLSEFQAANDGKIHVIRNSSTSEANHKRSNPPTYTQPSSDDKLHLRKIEENPCSCRRQTHL